MRQPLKSRLSLGVALKHRLDQFPEMAMTPHRESSFQKPSTNPEAILWTAPGEKGALTLRAIEATRSLRVKFLQQEIAPIPQNLISLIPVHTYPSRSFLRKRWFWPCFFLTLLHPGASHKAPTASTVCALSSRISACNSLSLEILAF